MAKTKKVLGEQPRVDVARVLAREAGRLEGTRLRTASVPVESVPGGLDCSARLGAVEKLY